MNQIKTNKKASELSLQTIVVFIILIIVLVVTIYFFTSNYSENSTTIIDIGKGAIDTANS